MDEFKPDLDACRVRQQRLLAKMAIMQLDLVITNQAANVQWLSGARFPWLLQPVAALSADGKLCLVAPHKAPEVAAADTVETYEAKWHSTVRNDQMAAAMEVLQRTLGVNFAGRRIGVEFSSCGRHLDFRDAELLDIEPGMYQLRRRKEADELALIRKAIDGTEAMYQRARDIIRPGINELEVFNQLQSAAVEQFGEMMTGTGNDYQCCARGGPPRNRDCRAGELYILDLGPAFRGYFADNARTIAVSEPTDVQIQAWEFIMQAFAHVEANAKPGKSARELFQEVQSILDEAPVGKFNHHLGHGIGLFPHEAPHLNPNWDDHFEIGDVFTAEPGLYAEELKAGMRIENDYVVTENSVQRLTNFPLEL